LIGLNVFFEVIGIGLIVFGFKVVKRIEKGRKLRVVLSLSIDFTANF